MENIWLCACCIAAMLPRRYYTFFRLLFATSIMITLQDVNAAISQIKGMKAVQFVDWCPTGFKVTNVATFKRN